MKLRATRTSGDDDTKGRAYAAQAAKEAGLPANVKLPSAVQLAQIAAGFGANENSDYAIQRAVSLYLRATAFRAKHDNATALDVAQACDNELSKQLLRAATAVPIKRTCLLEPDKPSDEARRELAKSGLQLSRAKSMLENLRRLTRRLNIDHFLRKRSVPVTWTDCKPLRLWGESTDVESEEQSQRNEAKENCRMVSRKEYDERAETLAKEHGWSEADAEKEWKQLLAEVTEQRPDGSPMYRLPAFWLGDLLKWKKALKHSGGVKSRHARQSSKSS